MGTLYKHFLPTLVCLIMIGLLLSLLPAAQATDSITLSIPAINVNTPIVTVYIARLPEGRTWDVRRLGNSVGRLDGTGNFGQMGNTVLAGHSETPNRSASIFYNLGNLQVGDPIMVNVNGTQYHYSVNSVQRVPITDLSVLYPSSDERLTLMTCDPASYSGGSYTQRIIVTALRSA
ncbi:MAG: sortase [Chloroflexi bacterium]|nr:sortase [Chloroflexota bacterium]